MADNITFNQPMTFDKEIVIPQFDTAEDMNAYTPARAGALAQVGEDTYKYNGSAWVKFSDANSEGATFRGSINDL